MTSAKEDMAVEKKLTKLFDFQRFSGNDRLNAIIAGVEERYAGALADDDLELVSAAGDDELPAVYKEALTAWQDSAAREGETP